MSTGRIDLRILLYSCLVIIFVEIITRFAIVHAAMPDLLVIGAARIIETSLLIVIVSHWGEGLSAVGLDSNLFFEKLYRGFIWSAAFACIGGLSLFAIHIFSQYPLIHLRVSLPENSIDIILFFVVGGLIAPITEELFFRGILYGFLRQWGILLAVGGSTFIFSLAHYLTGNLQPIQVIGGLVFALTYETEKHLIVPIVIHVLGNLAIFTFALLV